MSLGKIPLSKLLGTLREIGVAPSLDANTVEGDLIASTNPAVGVPLEALGFFAFHYSASNVAVAHAQPLYATLSLTMPPTSTDEEASLVIKAFADECKRYGVKLIGGHTARYEGVEYPLAVSTVMGRRVRDRKPPRTGDSVYILGVVGAEAAWLLGSEVPLREMTPLDYALLMQRVPEVKFMHDVSEGGVLGALLEVSLFYGLQIEVQADGIKVYPGLPPELDPLTVPTYGALLVFTDEPAKLEAVCSDNNIACARIGYVKQEGVGVVYKSSVYTEPLPSPLVELYNPYTPGEFELAQVELAARSLLKTPGFEQLVPEVGSNIAFARTKPEKPEDVAAIEGRIVRTPRGLRVCGRVAYGASRHLARVLIEASKLDPRLRSAINLKPDPLFLEALRSMGIAPVDVSGAHSECPVSHAIATGARGVAFFYSNVPNLEPSLVILAETPAALVEIIREALNRRKTLSSPKPPNTR